MTEPADLPEILLRKAAGDESATRALIEATDVSDDILGFHIQQAIEKRLKAVLASRAVEYPYIHDLRRLCGLLEEAGIALPATAATLDAYTPFAAITRYEYPLDLPAVDRTGALELLERTRTWAESQIESPPHA